MVAQGRNELDGGGVGEGGADVMTDERRSHKGVFFFFLVHRLIARQGHSLINFTANSLSYSSVTIRGSAVTASYSSFVRFCGKSAQFSRNLVQSLRSPSSPKYSSAFFFFNESTLKKPPEFWNPERGIELKVRGVCVLGRNSEGRAGTACLQVKKVTFLKQKVRGFGKGGGGGRFVCQKKNRAGKGWVGF